MQATEVSRERDNLSTQVVSLRQELAEAKAARAKDPDNLAAKLTIVVTEYMLSIHILEENSLKNAKRLGYLDFRELYPDMPKHTLEEYAKEFYAVEDPGSTYA